MELQLQRMFYQQNNCLIEDMFSFYQGHIQNLLRSVGNPVSQITCCKSEISTLTRLFGIF